MGRKLTVISSSEKKIGRPTSLHASTMTRLRSDSGGAAASRTCAFSISTITASASSPMAMAIPPSDMMLDDRPRYRIPMNDIRTDSGSTIITTSADRAWNRKTRQMIVTMIACWISVFFNVSTDPRISSDRS